MIRTAFALLASSVFVPVLAFQADEPKPIKPTNLEKLNTAADEDDPHAGSSGLTLYYSSNAKKKFDIFVSRRTNQAQPWPAGQALSPCATWPWRRRMRASATRRCAAAWWRPWSCRTSCGTLANG